MRLKTYPLEANESLMTFEFTSEGPKGFIRKRVQFQRMNRKNMYNLAFGDVNIVTDDFDDKVVTDNNDSETVLATVAATVYIFTDKYPSATVYAKGSTLARTRLYRIGISNNLGEISKRFMIHGLLKGIGWAIYEKNKNYSAFLIKIKKQ